MRNPERTAKPVDEKLQLQSSIAAPDERLVEFVRALARCAAHRYIAESEKEHARDGS